MFPNIPEPSAGLRGLLLVVWEPIEEVAGILGYWLLFHVGPVSVLS